MELLVVTLVLVAGGGALASRLAGAALVERLLALAVATLGELVSCLIVAGLAKFLRPVPVALEYLGVSTFLVLVCRPGAVWTWFLRLGRDAWGAVRTGSGACRR